MFENLKKYKTLYNKRFIIFEIENFLSEENYKNIYDNFPKLNNNELDPLSVGNGKFSINYLNSELYNSKIMSNKALKELHNSFSNKENLEKILKITKQLFLFDKNQSFYKKMKIFFRKFKFIDHPGRVLPKKSFFQRLCYNYVWPSIEFSYMNKNAKLPPHTDSPSKLISLMLYFPDEDFSENQIKELGTAFYDSDIKNDKNIHQENEEETKFLKRNKKILTLPFRKKNLYGFFRNFYSWHGVENINLKENQLRKSINLNIMLY